MNLLEIQKSLLLYKEPIMDALPKGVGMSVDKMLLMVAAQIRQSSKLEKCVPESLFGSIIKASILGLNLDILGQAWIIP